MSEPKTIELKWDGYHRESNLSTMKNHQCGGVYAVYREMRILPFVKELLYIGRSNDISERPTNPSHHARPCWKKHLKPNERLWFSFADVVDEELAEAAIIHHLTQKCSMKLSCNKIRFEKFDHEETTIINTGKHDDIPDKFIVERTT